MRVLVTGARGFTGRYLIRELTNFGHTPVPLCANLMDLDGLRAEVNTDRFDAVVHLAGISTVTHKDANLYYQVNLIGSRNLFCALEDQKDLKAVLLTSSGQVYGRGDTQKVMITLDRGFRETDYPAPINEYGISKLAMEHLAELWQNRLPLLVTRPFNYTGVGQEDSFVIPKIVDHFRTRAPVLELGATDLWREFGDVRHVAACYRALIERVSVVAETPLDVYNICTGRARRLIDVIDICRSHTGHSSELRTNPIFVRAGEPKVLIGDPSRTEALMQGHKAPDLSATLSWMMNVDCQEEMMH